MGRRAVDRAASSSVARAVAASEVEPIVPAYQSFEAFRAEGGYQLLRDCLDGRRDREELITAVEQAELRGMGGAGFRSAIKWRLVRQQAAPRLMVVNADEGEPGTFKDRYISSASRTACWLACCWPPGWSRPRRSTSISATSIRTSARSSCGRSPRLDAEGLDPRHADSPPPRRRGVHLRRGVGDAREHRGQAGLTRATSPPSPRRSASSAGPR